MAASKKNALPRMDRLDQLVEFFDSHDMGDYWDEMDEAHLDLDIRRRKHLVVLEDDLAGKLAEIARSRHISSESLVNTLLREKLADTG